MKKTTKIWLITAALLVLVGCMIWAGVMTMFKWDFTKLSTVKYETNEHDIREEFSNISIETDTADLTFALSDDGRCRVECYEESKLTHSVTVQEDTLVIKMTNEKSWYDYIGISFGSPKITVYLPKAAYAALSVCESTGDIKIPQEFTFESVDIVLSTGDVDFSAAASKRMKIKTSTGDIRVENSSADSLDLSVSTGEVYLTDIMCKNLTTSGNTGDIFLKNVIAAEKFSIVRSTGDAKLDGCDAAEISIKTDTGDVTGSLLSEKVFFAQADTGRVNVPKTTSGGKCEITTNTGDIQITIK